MSRVADDEFDMFLEDDDDFFAKHKKNRMEQMRKEIQKKQEADVDKKMEPVAIVATEEKIDHKVFDNLVQTFKEHDKKSCILDYVKRGPELNFKLRQDNSSDPLVKCLEDNAMSIKSLIRNSGDYIILYRSMTKDFDTSKSKGFLSTSNRIIPGFGNYWMKIYVPTSIRILVTDISKETKDISKNEIQKTFEIILPRGQVLIFIGKKYDRNYNDYINYFIALTNNEDENNKILEVIKRDLSSS